MMPSGVEQLMNLTSESLVRPAESSFAIKAVSAPDRRSDIDAKQTLVAGLLREAGCGGVVGLEPEDFAWLTGGAAARGILDPGELPALYVSPEGRWVLSGNVDSQRLFDEELDGLGFQLKEWPWHWGRQQLLDDLCQGRKVASD